jgi:hypothetical protein
MIPRLLVALACLAAIAGCATPLTTSTAPSYDGAASPATVRPAVLPPNAFGPEPQHDFGSGGP